MLGYFSAVQINRMSATEAMAQSTWSISPFSMLWSVLVAMIQQFLMVADHKYNIHFFRLFIQEALFHIDNHYFTMI